MSRKNAKPAASAAISRGASPKRRARVVHRSAPPDALAVGVALRASRHDTRVGPLLRRVARLVATAEGFRQGTLSIAVVGRAAMASLHQRHSGVAGATDVLTFDLRDDDPPRWLIDAEIVVCADVARQRVGTRGDATRELALYVAHGVLHLAGYDDHSPRDFARMHAREDELMARLGLGRQWSLLQAPDFKLQVASERNAPPSVRG